MDNRPDDPVEPRDPLTPQDHSAHQDSHVLGEHHEQPVGLAQAARGHAGRTPARSDGIRDPSGGSAATL